MGSPGSEMSSNAQAVAVASDVRRGCRRGKVLILSNEILRGHRPVLVRRFWLGSGGWN